MKLLPFLLVLLFGGCAPRGPVQPLTPAQLEARERSRQELERRGFTTLDNLLAFIPRAPGSTRGFAK